MMNRMMIQTMYKNQIITGKCIDYTYDGLGLLKHEGFCIFVKDMALNDEAEVIVTKVLKDYGYGRILKLLKKGEDRVEPACPLSRICGGCQLQHLSPAGQAAFKQGHVAQLMANMAKLDLEVQPIISMDEPYYYRNKIMLPVEVDKNGELKIGFYRYNSHDIIPIENCLLQSSFSNELVEKIRELIISHHLEKEIRHIMIRDMRRNHQAMVVLVTYKEKVTGLKALAEQLLAYHPDIKSVIQSVNGGKTNVVLGQKEILLAGNDCIYDRLCDLTFKISAHSFYQVNSYQTEVLYKKAIELAGLDEDSEVLDLYCGVGTIGLSASRQVKRVTGVEIVQQAIDDARINAQLNGIQNAEFICGDAQKISEQLLRENRHFDCIFVDPPRKGCSAQTIEILRNLNAEKIVYISCNPSTLARDLNLLREDYQVKVIQPVDMFPQTYHVETVVLMTKKQPDRRLRR